MRQVIDVDGWNQIVRQNAYTLDLDRVAGWDVHLSEVQGAILLPQTVMDGSGILNGLPKRAYDGGVYTADWRIVPEALHVGGTHRHVPGPRPETTQPLRRLPGRWLYGGLMRGHFGHFLVESLGRLWGLDEQREKFDGIIFLNLNTARSAEPLAISRIITQSKKVQSLSYVRQLLEVLGDDLPFEVVGPATQVDSLTVPSQLMGNNNQVRFIGGHPTYRNFVKRKVDSLAPSPAKKVYISRSKLAVNSSSFFLEGLLENDLAKQGYEIIHPQNHSVREQLSIYKSAEKVIAGAGSALHLLALATGEHQDLAILDREFAGPSKFATQLKSMGARSVTRIDALNGRVRPQSEEDVPKINWRSSDAIHSLDFPLLWSALGQAGFIDQDAPCGVPDLSTIEGELARIGKEFGGIALAIEGREVSHGMPRQARPPQHPRRMPFPGPRASLSQGLPPSRDCAS